MSGEYTSAEVAMAQIAHSQVIATFERDEDVSFLSVSLPYDLGFSGESADNIAQDFFMGLLEVEPEELRHHGIGLRLFSAMAYAARANGFQRLHSAVSSPYSVKIVKKLFSEEAVNFYDHDPIDRQTVLLPISLGEAILILEKCEATGESLGLEIDLKKVDLETLERPIIYTAK